MSYISNMNIFVLDSDIDKCVEYHNNKHCVKMIVEYAQLLCGVHHMTDSELDIPYRLSHKNHPCAIWARECIENYVWLCDLALALAKEYTHRYKKVHKSQRVIEWCIDNFPNLKEDGELTPFAQAMPDEYRSLDGVEAYRRYYIMDKQHIAEWKEREVPYWYEFKDELIEV